MFGRTTHQASRERTVKQRSRDGSSSAPAFKPYGLAGDTWEFAAAGGFVLTLILVFVAGLIARTSVEFTPIGLIVVIAAAWLLSTPFAIGVTTFAIGLLAVEAAAGEVAPVTAAVEAGVFAVLAVSGRFYATRLHRLLEGTDADLASVASNVFGLESLAHLVDASTDGVAAIDDDGRIRYANTAARELLGGSRDSVFTSRFIDNVVPKDRSRVLSELDSAAVDRATRVNFHIRAENGVTRELEVSHTPLLVRGRPVTALWIRDVTEVKQLQLAAGVLAETAANLAVTQPLEQTLEVVARRVAEVSQASACAVLLLESKRKLRMAGSWGLPAGYAAAADVASERGADLPAMRAIRTKAPVFVEDLPSRIRAEAQFANMRSVSEGVPWRLAVAIPMIHRGRPLGALAVYFPTDRRPDGPTLNFLSVIAGQAASASQISRLVAAAQGQVVGEERHRLSRELHDSLSQELYGIVLGAKSAQARLATDPGHLAEPLNYIVELADGALADMRGLVLELRPESLEKQGLIVALDQCANAMKSRHGLDVSRQLPDEPDLPFEIKLLAYRIVQEALHNVVKHGHAKHAWLRLGVDNGSLEIVVMDDGDGFDPNASFTGHFGLESMRERVNVHGGQIHIESSPGSGTAVRVRVPIRCEPSTLARVQS